MGDPHFFRCPISMAIMKDPVTISTGVTYERKNIEKWFFAYKKKMCPATMQCVENFDLTPNHNLQRLITSWKELNSQSPSSSCPSTSKRINKEELVSLFTTIESTPFKVGSLKKLRSLIEVGDEIKADFANLGGIDLLGSIIFQILIENVDFSTFRACEEALGVLHHLPLSDEASIRLLSKPKYMMSMVVMLQRGSAEARLHTVTILRKMAKIKFNWNWVSNDHDMDIFKSLLELLSDEIFTKASSCALHVLIEISRASKKNRQKAIEAGAVCILIELLPESNRSKCDKMLLFLKLLCECPEGRSAFVDHGLAIAVVTKKILGISELSTKLAVKILWLICNLLPKERILEDILVLGSVQKLLALLHIDGRSSTKEKVTKMIKLHGTTWRKYPCFPSDLKDYLRIMHDTH